MNEKLYTHCPKCDGRGWYAPNSDKPFYADSKDCPMCNATGYIESGLHTGQTAAMSKKLTRLDPIMWDAYLANGEWHIVNKTTQQTECGMSLQGGTHPFRHSTTPVCASCLMHLYRPK